MSDHTPDDAAEVSADAIATDGPTSSRRRIILIAVAAVAAVAIVVALVLAFGAGGTPAASPSGSATPSSDASSDPGDPSGSPTPDGSATPVPGTPTTTPLDEPADIVDGVTASIGSIESVTSEPSGPGEIAGPAIRFVVTIANAGSTAVDLTSTVVTAYFGADAAPALELQKPGGDPLPATIAPGATVTGTYVFNVPTESRDDVQIMVDYSVDVSPLVFRGAVPR